MAPTPKVWKRRDFIAAWNKNGTEKMVGNDWQLFFMKMNEDRVAHGCNPYKSDAGLAIQIGKIRKGCEELGATAPRCPVKPTKAPKKAPTLEEDLKALGLL
jgi:hypothetical protein|tara:strand:- start:153 stop:455 length:303 start_codon:yes stop_codon:yes gene_type:complete